uniref:Putative secreted protein n=1 Tax=Anopheles darlingi TaxID=43151 RepID=A0A2M4DKT3_ANODA
MQHQVVLVFRFLMTHRALELWLNATLEAYVPVQAVRSGVRVAAPGTRVCTAGDWRRHYGGRGRRHAHALEQWHR